MQREDMIATFQVFAQKICTFDFGLKETEEHYLYREKII